MDGSCARIQLTAVESTQRQATVCSPTSWVTPLPTAPLLKLVEGYQKGEKEKQKKRRPKYIKCCKGNETSYERMSLVEEISGSRMNTTQQDGTILCKSPGRS